MNILTLETKLQAQLVFMTFWNVDTAPTTTSNSTINKHVHGFKVQPEYVNVRDGRTQTQDKNITILTAACQYEK